MSSDTTSTSEAAETAEKQPQGNGNATLRLGVAPKVTIGRHLVTQGRSTNVEGLERHHIMFGSMTDPEGFLAVFEPAPPEDGDALDILRDVLAPGWPAFGRPEPNPVLQPEQGLVLIGYRIERDGHQVFLYRAFDPADDLSGVDIRLEVENMAHVLRDADETEPTVREADEP